jgi:hypothetical protein
MDARYPAHVSQDCHWVNHVDQVHLPLKYSVQSDAQYSDPSHRLHLRLHLPQNLLRDAQSEGWDPLGHQVEMLEESGSGWLLEGLSEEGCF